MPYASKSQEKYMHAKMPKLAEKWDKEINDSKGASKKFKKKGKLAERT